MAYVASLHNQVGGGVDGLAGSARGMCDVHKKEKRREKRREEKRREREGGVVLQELNCVVVALPLNVDSHREWTFLNQAKEQRGFQYKSQITAVAPTCSGLWWWWWAMGE